MSDENSDWSHYENTYRPLYENLREFVMSQNNIRRISEEQKISNSLSLSLSLSLYLFLAHQFFLSLIGKLQTIDFIRLFGVKALREELCIAISRHSRHPNLILLSSNSKNSPKSSAVTQECAGGVLLDENDHWRVVAMGHPMIFTADDRLAPPIDWATAEVTEKIGEVS